MHMAYETLFLLRVYALYQYNLKIGLLCLGNIALQLSLALFIAIVFPSRAVFDGNCATRPIMATFVLVTCGSVSQGIIWILTWCKKRQLAEEHRIRRPNPALHVVYRDGAIGFVFIIMCLGFFIPYASAIHIDIHGYTWSQALLSVIGCRTTLNMLRLGNESTTLAGTQQGGLFSTIIDTMPPGQARSDSEHSKITTRQDAPSHPHASQ